MVNTGIKPCISGIYPHFDWYTAVWNNATIMDVFDWYGLVGMVDPFCLECDVDIITRLGLEHWNISFKGLSLKIKTHLISDFQEGTPLEVVLNQSIPEIIFDVSGGGCAELADYGIDLYDLFRNPLPECAHVTRVDLAYDLVDYKPEFLDKCIDFVSNRENLTENGRLCICNLKGGVSFEQHLGSRQKTLYLGAPRSDRLLRIYDKKLQYTDQNGVFDKNNRCPYKNVDSWIRVEWQLRNKKAFEILFADATPATFWPGVFKKIYNTYKFRDLTQKGTIAAKFWDELFNFGDVDEIIQNQNYCTIVTQVHQIEAAGIRAIPAFIDFINVIGYEKWYEMCVNYLYNVNQKINSTYALKYRRHMFKLNSVYSGSLSVPRSNGTMIGDKFMIKIPYPDREGK